jgi:hypothetical protein
MGETKSRGDMFFDAIKAEEVFNPDIQVSAKITLTEKAALLSLAHSKGAEGLTGLLRMLAKAKEVAIKL